MPVGELFLGAFLQVLFEKLASGLILAFARRERIYKLLKKWSQTLQIIQAVIDDAEDKQLTDKAVKVWLEHLRDLAYDLDDVLDEITTQALIQESEGVPRTTAKVWRFIPSCKECTPGAFMFKKRIRDKMEEITSRLDNISRDGNSLNLSKNVGGPSNASSIHRLPSTSVIEPHVYGRDKDKENVCRLMVGNPEKVSVIPIVGMGGIGKTTLAQLIYNDEILASSFDLKAWVCVSEEFDVFGITKTVFHSVTKSSTESKDLNMLQERLKETLSKKRFLLILDDVWNEDYVKWEAFVCPFLFGLPGSKVLVTTRYASIGSMVGSVPCYQVQLLNDRDCLSLLVQHALGKDNFDEHPDLKLSGIALARKCKGLPLAAKTLGGLLRSKDSPAEWEDVLLSKIWDLPQGNTNILPVLRLSYHHLPSHLKNLFAYCSIFPKDYEFERNEIVQLWMGEGFLPQTEARKTREQLGFEYFNELLSRSFFQRLSNNESRFVMHDLINDLAQFVAGSICYKLDEKVETSDEYEILENARHASFLRHEYEVFQKFRGFYKVKGLRTFIPMPVENIRVWPPFYLSNRILSELIPKLHNLRVLSLSGYSITELPSSICALFHLRYLNLSGTSISSLPDSLNDLFNLETLSIRNCRFISKLPPTVGDLINLRHLDNSNTDQLKELPVDIGKLQNLQTLPKIAVRKNGGLGLKELRNLELLRGSVTLSDLQNVVDVDHAKEASIRRKNELEELQLIWEEDIDGTRDGRREEAVLDALQPHENLKGLKIEFYGGVRFPNWIGDPSFRKLSSISLGGCANCSSLPPVGELPELRHLRVRDMPKIKRIGVGMSRMRAMDVLFPKLETLRFDDMPEWEEWSCSFDETQIQFPCLQQLTIFNCPKLTRVSSVSLPVLRKLDLEKCSLIILRSFRDLDSLSYLKVEFISGLSDLPMEFVQSVATLEVLECCNCNDLLSLWPNGISLTHLSRLRRLVIADCLLLESLGEEEQILPCNLEVLEIFRCGSLTSLPNDLSNLMSLRELIIKNCPKIMRFPESGIPSVLKRLEILSCKALESLPGDISKLERLEVKECPSLKTWSETNFPRNMKKLSIKNCSKLEPVSDSMFPPNRMMISLEELSMSDWPNFSTLLQNVHSFLRLAEIYLSHCDSLDYFPEQGMPPRLRSLSIEHCPNLRSLPKQVQDMGSLLSLEIRSCRRLKSFPRCDFPPNLSSLRIWDSRKLKPLSKWGLRRLASLKEFSICGGFPELQVLPNEEHLFPSSLIKFSIARFPKLTSLSGVLENLNSLQHLSIMNCSSLNILPSENLLEKLWHLEISDCQPLSQRCLRDRGDYWPKIAGIPCVEIDGTYIYRQS